MRELVNQCKHRIFVKHFQGFDHSYRLSNPSPNRDVGESISLFKQYINMRCIPGNIVWQEKVLRNQSASVTTLSDATILQKLDVVLFLHC